MSKVKCIIRQDWTTRDAAGNLIDRHEFVYVTNEDGTPHVYDSISEARAEIVGNYGRDANKRGILHNHSVDDYSGNVHDGYIYIIREDSEEYAEIMEEAEQEAAPEYTEPEHIQTVSGHKIYRSVDPVTGWNVFTVAGRDFWELAEARYFAQCNPAEEYAKRHDGMTETERTASSAVSQLIEEYAAAIGAASYEVEQDIWQAAYRVAAVEIIPEDDRPAGYTTATAEDRAAVVAMVEAIADRARAEEPAPAPIYQRYDLEAFLGEPDAYDVDAIEAEATEYDPRTGALVWAVFGSDLAAIAERHELFTYAAI